MKRREPNTEQLELNMAALPELCYAVIEDFTGESETRVGIIKRRQHLGRTGHVLGRADGVNDELAMLRLRPTLVERLL